MLVAVGLVVSPEPGTAVSEVRLEIGDIDGGTWQAQGVVLRLAIGADATAIAEVSASRMTLPAGLGSMERVTLTCPDPIVREPEFRCERARVVGYLAQLGAQSFTLEAGYNSRLERLEFNVAGVKVATGTLRMTGRWMPSGWQTTLDGTPMPIATLQKLAAPWLSLPEGFQAGGRAAFHVEARGAESLTALDVRATIEELTSNNAAGTLATDKLALSVDARLRPVGDEWSVEGRLRSARGQVYSEPIFIDLAQHPLAAKFAVRWHEGRNALSLASIEFDQQGIAKGKVRGELDFAREPLLRALHVDLETLIFPGAYASVFQPFLLSTELKDLTTAGRVHGTVGIADGAPAAIDLTLDNVSAEDKAGKLAMQGVRGRVVWRSNEGRGAASLSPSSSPSNPEAESRLQWNGARLYGLSGGPASLRFIASGPDFRLLEPTMLPILDGGLAINALSIRSFGTPELSLRFDAELKPISMRLLSEAFGWPTFAGTIEGRIPNVTLDERVLSFGGDLEARIFDGRVVVSALKLRDPLGTYPRLSAHINMRNLDLEALTGTFSFGTITGRLDADVRDLELFRWQPIRFDARLYTPTGDESKHLISQRAVNNLSNIGGGGGVAAALQSSVLRFFDNFRYARLGLSCRLENEVCFMDGVEPAGGTSYYIVKGSGIPRIDIIGDAHRVNWNRLVGQLQAIQKSGGPVVQ